MRDSLTTPIYARIIHRALGEIRDQIRDASLASEAIKKSEFVGSLRRHIRISVRIRIPSGRRDGGIFIRFLDFGFLDALFTSETSTPHAARRIEAVVQPLSSFDQAILAIGMLDLNNQNIVVDSYDSRDSTKSTNGLYDVTKRQENGNIATDGTILDAGGAYVYGDVSTNSGTATGVDHVTGQQRTDFYQDPIPIGAPTWSSINPTPSTVNNVTTTLTASATEGSSSARYVLSTIDLSGGKTLTLAGAGDGSTTYIEIYVTGDISISGNSQITVAPGVKATVYFKSDVDITGNGIVNQNNQPGNLLLYGVQPSDGETPHVKLGGNGEITAAVYAPGHDVTINGGGTDGHVYGSAVGKTVTMTGVTNLDQLPERAQVVVAPLKVHAANGGPVRILALLPE